MPPAPPPAREEPPALLTAVVCGVCGIGGLGLLAWALAWALRLDPVQATVLLAFSALPTASSCYVLAARMGYNGPYVAGLVTLSTVLGLASLPLALGLLGRTFAPLT